MSSARRASPWLRSPGAIPPFGGALRDAFAAGAILEIEVSVDPDDPHAQYVRLESVDLDE
jgi:hypothetical protein